MLISINIIKLFVQFNLWYYVLRLQLKTGF